MARNLKDWYVNFSKIKNNINVYQKYLLSKKRHPMQEIKQISNNTIPYLKADLEQWNSYKKGRGSRPKQNGYDITISLPFDLNDDEWQRLYKNLLFKMYYNILSSDKFNVLIKTNTNKQKIINNLISRVYCVRHRSNHIHLIVPTLYFNKKLQLYLDMTKKKYSFQMKQDLDLWLQKNKSISKHSYIIEDEARRFKISQKQAKQERNKKVTSELLNELQILTNEYDILKSKVQQLNSGVMKTKLEKRISTAKSQIKNKNTMRAKSTIEKVKSAIVKYSFSK